MERFARHVGIHLATSQADGRNAMHEEPVAVEPAVADRQDWLAPDGSHRLACGDDTGSIFVQLVGFVVEPTSELYAPPLPEGAADFLDRPLERLFNLRLNRFAKLRVVAATLRPQFDAVGDDIRRFTPLDEADVARASLSPLLDQAQPTVALQIGNRQRRNTDRAHSLFGSDSRMTGDATDDNLHPIAAGRADRELGRRTAVEIEGQLRFA